MHLFVAIIALSLLFYVSISNRERKRGKGRILATKKAHSFDSSIFYPFYSSDKVFNLIALILFVQFDTA